MASVFGHSILGFTISKLFDSQNLKWLLGAAIFSTILPDFDVLGYRLGIAYEHPFGHRGFSHSIIFALLWSVFLMITIGKKNKVIWFVVIFLSTISHGLLDAITTGGMGIGFFIPFDNSRYFLPWSLIEVSPLGIRSFFSEWGLKVIFSEIRYVFLPCFIILFARYFFNLIKGNIT